ncbi:MAG TPA: hypothetical protein VFT74_19090 [Isosphaeraceae bacterium]|nr:hypothetical protein [Isosphaeraceae bacterium]
MIFRIYPSKDTFITNDFRYPNYTRLSGANVGASEELDVFKRAGISGAAGDIASSSLARILMQFDFSQYAALTASGDIPSTGVSFRLRMNHKTAACTHPTSFDLVVLPVSSSWDEGRGKDVDLGDSGFANWVKRTSTAYWATPGGDFAVSPSFSAHFDDGTEDLEVDVTQLVTGWLDGTIPNNGLGVMMTSSIEDDSVYIDFYQKKFYSRQTDFDDRVPYIEARFDDSTRDDRVNMAWGRSGSLYLYNIVGGSYQDLPSNDLYVAVSDASGVLTYLTASRGVMPGIYSASLCLPTGSGLYSGSVFYDSWFSGSYDYGTGSFSLTSSLPRQSVSQRPLTARIRNMRDEYSPEDVEVFEVFFRKQQSILPVFQTASLGSTPYIVEQAYYAIENDSTRERVIPFGTGSEHQTRLSYGAEGNSFRLFMRNLHSGNVYRIIFLVYEGGRQQVIDGGFKFKVI